MNSWARERYMNPRSGDLEGFDRRPPTFLSFVVKILYRVEIIYNESINFL